VHSTPITAPFRRDRRDAEIRLILLTADYVLWEIATAVRCRDTRTLEASAAVWHTAGGCAMGRRSAGRTGLQSFIDPQQRDVNKARTIREKN